MDFNALHDTKIMFHRLLENFEKTIQVGFTNRFCRYLSVYRFVGIKSNVIFLHSSSNSSWVYVAFISSFQKIHLPHAFD